MATRRIREYLIGNKITFSSINHTCAYTAQEVAESSHIPGRYMAKVVLVWLDDELVIVAVPATKVVDLIKLRYETGAIDVRLAEEDEFRDRFSGCQVGTVPPFGNLFGVETIFDRQLTTGEKFAFNAGTHRDVVVIRFADYNKLVKPHIVDVAEEQREGAFVKSHRPGGRNRRSGSRAQPGDSLSNSESAMQTQCGCPILHHAGAD